MVKKEGKGRDRAGRSGVGKEGKEEVEEGLVPGGEHGVADPQKL